MGRFGEIWRRVRMLVRREEFARALEEEMGLHREMKETELRAGGADAREAQYAANRAFGNTTVLRERGREAWGWRWLEDFVADVRFGARMLRKSPGFTIVALMTLALGIGVNTAIFTLVHAVMLRSLPVAKPEQLYNFGANDNCCVMSGMQDNFTLFSVPLYERLRDHSPEFQEVAAFLTNPSNFGVRRAGASKTAEPYHGELVSGNYFETLGISAFAGRTITREDDQMNAAPVAMMSYRVWSQHFASDPTVIGGSFVVNSVPVTVAGITPPGFFGETLRSDPPDFWMPLAQEPHLAGETSVYRHPELYWLYVIGRLRPGTSPEQAGAHLTAELRPWLAEQPSVREEDRKDIARAQIVLTPARSGVASVRADYANGLQLLTVVSGLVLLIACANIANMLLARGTAERRQTTVRAALGASQLRLVRQTMTESVLLAALGGAAGIAVAFGGTRVILALAFRGAEFVPIDATPSWPVLLFALALSLLTGVLFGVVPAWIGSRANPAEALRGTGRTTPEGMSLPRKSLVVLQAAMSLVLLAGAGLLTVSLQRLEHQQFGFQTRGRMLVKVDPRLAGYTSERLAGLYRQLESNLQELPGVVSTSLSFYSPLEDMNWTFRASIEGHSEGTEKGHPPAWNRVSAHYFETLGTRVLRGRSIGEQDTPAARRVAVINESFAKKYFAKEEPIGKHVGMGEAKHSGDYEIVGIVEDAKYNDAYLPAQPRIFVALLQNVPYEDPSDVAMQTRSNFMYDIELLTEGQPVNLEAEIQRTLAAIDPNLTVLKVVSLADQVSLNFNQERLIARLTGLFGLLALVLACVGLYGVTAYGVAQRKSEIGIRMALGADRPRVVSMVVSSAMRQIGLGLAVGIPIALAGGRALAHQLFGVKSYDPLVLGAAVLMLGISAALAGLVPALRAASIDPMEALRAE
jgi:predicted permease